MSKARVIALVLALIACASEARAEAACPDPGTAWLSIRADPPFDAAPKVVAQLRTELATRGVAVCLASSKNAAAQSPLAEVAMALERDALILRVEDRATDKRLERTVSLRGIPADARALAMAVAIDELVRASWIEALLERAADDPTPPPVAPPPPVVIAIAKETVATRMVGNDHAPELPNRAAEPRADVAHARGALALMLAGEHATGGLSWGGFDARAAYGARFAIGGRLGYRLGAIATADHGEVASNAAIAGLSLSYALFARSAFGNVALFVGGDAARVTFAGRAGAGATATSDSGWGLLAGGGVRANWVVARNWALAMEISAQAPLRPVAALDDGARVVALSGAVLGLAIGIEAGL